jgi:peptidoglycan/LPS O-acetylase OafA/YrhL
MPFILSQFLDACRWLGALLVLGVHSTNMLVSLGDIFTASHSPAVYAWWFVVAYEFGHQAVVSFFVMSGYLVGGAVVAQIRKQKPFLQEYFIHRFARIYVVVAPAIALTFLLDQTGRIYFPDAGIYDLPAFHGHFTLSTLFGNLTSLQGIWADFYGTNGPLWSLACEFWYYVTFPLLLLPFARNYPPLLRFGGFALGLILVALLATPVSWFSLGYLLWVIGAGATLLTRPLIRSRWAALALYIVAIIPVRLLVRGPILDEYPWLPTAADILMTLLFANLMATLRFSPANGWPLLKPQFHKRLADFSFSLYSIHMPALVFCRALVDHFYGRGWASALATPAHWGALGAAMTATVATAYVFSRFTEAQTGAARKALRSALARFGERATAGSPAAPLVVGSEEIGPTATSAMEPERVS